MAFLTKLEAQFDAEQNASLAHNLPQDDGSD